jgi:hypothetical protein
MGSEGIERHWHKEPAGSTQRLVAAAPFTPTDKGFQVAIEVIAYPGNQVQVATSVITGKPGHRKIVQAGEKPLMFNDIREAKDAIDLILDRLNELTQAAKADAVGDTPPVPVESWIPHPQSDWVDWMDKKGVNARDLTPEQREVYDRLLAEKESGLKDSDA